MTSAQIAGDLLLLALLGAVTEFAVHFFLKERSFPTGVIASVMSVVTVLCLVSYIPDIKVLLRGDSIDFTTTFFVPGALDVVAVFGGGLIIFPITRRFLHWRQQRIVENAKNA